MKKDLIKTLHERALAAAKEFRRTEKELLDALREIDGARAYLSFGVPSLFDYARKCLGLTEDVAYYFVRVARVSAQVPQLKAALDEGKLSVSKARQVVSVITPETAVLWTEKAMTLSQRELQREVAQAKGEKEKPERIRPLSTTRSEMRCPLSLELEKKIARMRDLLSQKWGRACGLEEALEAAVGLWLEREDPLEKAKRSKAPVLRQKTKTIPAAVKHEVIRRDGARCSYTHPVHGRCEARRHLHLHHLVPRAYGGEHKVSNLAVMCSSHHRHIHEQGERRAAPAG